MKKRKISKRNRWFAAIFVVVNVLGVLAAGWRESGYIESSLSAYAREIEDKTVGVIDNYKHSFQLFSQMMAREIKNNPDPDDIWDYLKGIDSAMLEIEGETFDGLYMYYQGRYLYSWDTPYSQYEETGYEPTERPWYKDAVAGKGEVVFTPPYMSYANHYILSTISQLQPDGETVFAYDIKMGDIQEQVSSQRKYGEELLVFDNQGTIVGSTNEAYLGGALYASAEDAEKVWKEASAALSGAGEVPKEQKQKLESQAASAQAFYTFRQSIDGGLSRLREADGEVLCVELEKSLHYGYLLKGEAYSYLVLVPFWIMLKNTLQIWLLPLLVMELLLIYILGRVGKELKNRELKAAYVELGQTQRRLEVALSVAQKAAAIDDLTGIMNFKSFRKSVSEYLEEMAPEERGILIMLDGDRFKGINDQYGHLVGDEVIKLSAQMIIGRIRTVDLASRLHGDEFAIFVAKTEDYEVAKRIIEDINSTLAQEAGRRKLPAITMSAGAAIAKNGDSYTAVAKAADEALYKAKETHNGGFARAEECGA